MMRVEVLVKPKSSKRAVVVTGTNQLTVFVHEPPVDNKANHSVIELLAEHFKVSKSDVSLVRGSKGRHKVFEVNLKTSTKIKILSTRKSGKASTNH